MEYYAKGAPPGKELLERAGRVLDISTFRELSKRGRVVFLLLPFCLLPFYFLLNVGGFEVIDDFLGEDVEISNITPDTLLLTDEAWSKRPDLSLAEGSSREARENQCRAEAY